jgi:hypothetical protein
MSALIRQAALWWLAIAALSVFLYGAASLIVRFPPAEHRLAYAVLCLASLFAVMSWIEIEPVPGMGARE